jgi:hypothetical protein
LNVWIPVPEESAVVQAAAERGWAIRQGEIYRIKSEPAVRVTIATLTAEQSVRLASDIAAAMRPRYRSQSA